MQIAGKKFVGTVLVATVVMFVWGGLSHMVLFVGAGFKRLPEEDQLIELLRTRKSEEGLYFFPSKDLRHSTKEEDMAWENKFRNGPAGLLVYRAVGGEPFSPSKLGTQFLSNLASVVLAAFVAASICAGFWRRVFAVTAIGITACSAVSTIYWNWYGFPTDFFVAQIADMTIGFFLSGVVLCRMIPAAFRAAPGI